MLKNSEAFEADGHKGKKRTNKSEVSFMENMVKHDWKILTKGYPDFICVKNHELIAVEVKPRRGVYLKESQHEVMSLFSKHGIKCYRWNPDDGFIPFSNDSPARDVNGNEITGKSVAYEGKRRSHLSRLLNLENKQ